MATILDQLDNDLTRASGGLAGLPRNADPNRAKAAYRSGVLTVDLPKTVPSRRLRMTVQ